MLRRPTISANVVDMLPDSGRRGFLARSMAGKGDTPHPVDPEKWAKGWERIFGRPQR